MEAVAGLDQIDAVGARAEGAIELAADPRPRADLEVAVLLVLAGERRGRASGQPACVVDHRRLRDEDFLHPVGNGEIEAVASRVPASDVLDVEALDPPIRRPRFGMKAVAAGARRDDVVNIA